MTMLYVHHIHIIKYHQPGRVLLKTISEKQSKIINHVTLSVNKRSFCGPQYFSVTRHRSPDMATIV